MFDSCICVDPDDLCQLLSRHRRKACEWHKCGECGCVIQPGDTYEVDNVVFGGTFTNHKTCLGCLRVRESLFRCGWYYGDLWSDVHEAFCDGDECVCPETNRGE